MNRVEIKSYRDCAKQKVVVGDEIAEFDALNQVTARPLGKVTKITKQGFYCWVQTDKFGRRRFWGVFTKKV